MFDDYRDWVGEADDQSLLSEMKSLEEARRRLVARQSVVLAAVEERKLYRDDGHATMHGLLRADLHWSNAECARGMRLARHVGFDPALGESLYESWVSVANAEQLAETAVSVKLSELDDPAAERDFAGLQRLAERHEHDDLRLRCREFERRVARRECDAEAADAHERRTAHVHVSDSGGELAAEVGQLDAIEMAEIFGTYVDAEWQADWDAAKAEHGDDATPSHLPRTDAQRRADALKQIFVDAAASKQRGTVVRGATVVLDHATFRDVATEFGLLPELDVDPFDDPTPHVSLRMARTEHGDALDHRTILRILIDGYVRWVIHDDEGVPIRWGRRRRLFEGAAREAVQSMSTRCTTPGCRVRVKHCEIDHLVEWAAGGATDPDNGAAKCRRHNQAKNRGFTATRDRTGFHTYRPDGTEIP